MEPLLVSIDDVTADANELDELARGLRRDLLELPVTDVQSAPAGPAPEGSRGVDPSSVNELIVLLSSSATLLVSVVTAIRSWRRHTIPNGSVRLRLGEDEIEVTGLSEETEAQLIDDWARRHGD
jgi:hypothetical protein